MKGKYFIENVLKLVIIFMVGIAYVLQAVRDIPFSEGMDMITSGEIKNVTTALVSEMEGRFIGKEDFEIYEIVLEQVAGMKDLTPSETATSQDDFSVELTDEGYVRIVSYNGTASEVEIPSIINGFPVAIIADYAFRDNLYLEKIVMPDTIINVGSEAFYNCAKLHTVEASGRLMRIEAGAFAECSALTNFVKRDIKNGISYQYIGMNAFLNCSSLTSIEFKGDTFRHFDIQNCAFMGCSSLTEIELPANTFEIMDSAFYDCTSLNAVWIAEDESSETEYTATIGNSAFYNTAIEIITIPKRYKTIAQSAFENCTQLKEVILPTEMLIEDEFGYEIGYAAFRNTAIAAITIPGCYYSIYEFAFENCSNLTRFEWETSGRNSAHQYMGGDVFADDFALTEIHLPITISEMGSWDLSRMGTFSIYTPQNGVPMQFAFENNIPVVTE